ncbi:MAG TPA: ComEC/Rec2 family competence protein [Pyrinomonadaceae bacterium]|nr:ComEC/Rec2 family competence protein [Pyrinomonadaceae bacterium]
MGRATRGCGCAIAVLALVIGAGGYAGYKYLLPWWKTKPPPASGAELRVHILDVGPINGDSILIVSPAGKSVLIDAGDSGKGKQVLEALKRNGVQQLDYFIGTHPHPDHLGAADEVMKGTKVLNVIDNGLPPTLPAGMVAEAKKTTPVQGRRTPAKTARPDKTASITKFYDDYKAAIAASGANYQNAAQGQIDLGGGARLTILAPTEPYFTRDYMKAGGNEANANSIVVRLDYGDFSMLLSGDAETQTEHRLLTKDLNLRANILKIAHHGSKYATAADFLERVKPSVAIISVGEWNRYGHPAQAVLDRLKALDVKLYRTDLQGEITITTRGRENDYSVKTAKEATEDLWAGRTAQKDDSSRSGFIAYGDFGPPPKERKRGK